MRLFKSFLPSILLLALAIYAHMNYTLLDNSLLSALYYLPILLIVLVGLICVHFNQVRLLVLVLIVSLSYLAFEYHWLDTTLKYNIGVLTVALITILTVLIREQGVFSPHSLPLYILILIAMVFALWLVREQPQWALTVINKQWLPAQYFDWTELTQSSLIVMLLAFIVLFSYVLLNQDHKSVAAIMVFCTIIIIVQIKLDKIDLMIVVTATLFLCLITVLQESWRMAYLDELTQLPGRRALREKLQSLVGVYTLAMVDVDFFKKFNDKYGHDTGDDVLRMIAAQLQKVSGGGMSYRYGGEEFTVVFANKSVDHAQEHLEKLRENIANTAFIVNRRTGKPQSTTRKKNKVTITVSIGACDSIEVSHSDEVLKKADAALYKAKKKGRNCVVCVL